jgi:diguanylate cyclase (GGDEF)-like protein
MKTGIQNDMESDDNPVAPRLSGRLELLVNNVCDVAGLRRNLKELNRIADFCTTVMSFLKPDEVLTAAAWKLHEYFQYKLFVFSDKPEIYDNAHAFYPGRIDKNSSGYDNILGCYPGLKVENLKGYEVLGLSIPRSFDVTGFDNYFELPLDMGFVRITANMNLLENHSEAFITRIFEILAICLRNAGDYGKVKDDSMRDSLTGLFNRRVLEEMLELEQRKREAVPLSLLLIDLDNFKAINDSFGHPAGDAVLRSAAATLTENSRGADLVVRYGGEEFAVMLPSTSASIALEVGERLRKCIENKAVEFNGNRIRVTASLGIAHRSGKDPFPVKEIMSQADQALYQAKKTGKNKVCFYSSSPVLVGKNKKPDHHGRNCCFLDKQRDREG